MTNMGKAVLQAASDALRSKITRIMGAGDYQLSTDGIVQNSLLSQNPVPSFSKRSIRLAKREYVCNIDSPATAGGQATYVFPLNLASPALGSWVAGVIPRFKRWRLTGAVLEYVATTGIVAAGSNSGLGIVVMGWMSDPLVNIANLGRHILQQEDGVIAMAPYKSGMVGIECARGETTREWFETDIVGFVKNQPLSNLPAKPVTDTTQGQIFVIVDGVPTTNTYLGDLMISYDVEVEEYTETLDVTPTFAVVRTAGNSSTTTGPVGTAYDTLDTSGGSFITTVAATQITTLTLGPAFVPGDVVQIWYRSQGSVTNNIFVTPGALGFVNCSVFYDNTLSLNAQDYALNYSPAVISVPGNVTNTGISQGMFLFTVKINNSASPLFPPVITIADPSSIYPNGTTHAQLFVTKLNGYALLY
jgi:hypothetical protein